MRAAIEALEGRTLFAGGGGAAALIARAEASSDPIVQATLELVQADQAAIQAAQQELASAAVESGPTLRSMLRAGFDLLAADREDIRNSKGDPEALATAKAKLKADRQQLRATLAAARESFRADTAEGRTDLREAAASLRTHLKQLRADLRNARFAANAGLETQYQPPGLIIKFTHRTDTNLDGLITPDDSAIFGGFYDERPTPPPTDPTFHETPWDMNLDGVIDDADAALFYGHPVMP